MNHAWFLAGMGYSAALLSMGILGFLLRRNILVLLMCIELMLNGANMALVTMGRFYGEAQGRVAASLVMVVAAAEAAVGLTLAIAVFRRWSGLDRERLIMLGETRSNLPLRGEDTHTDSLGDLL